VLATAIAFTEATMKLGLAADDFVSRYGFHFAIDDDFFESIAKLRAFRRMWSKTTKERWGCQKPKSFKTIIQAETAGTSLTAQQPLNNLMRAGIQTLAAVLGGATSVWTTHYDEALSIPTEESATLSLRTQQVIYHETNAANVADPLGGSYFLEWLTEEIEEQATTLARKIEKMGFLNCWRNGWLRRELEDSAFKWRQKLESKEKIKVGVNKYKVEEEMDIKTHQPDLDAEEIIVRRVQEFRKKRDSTKTKAALSELEKAAINLKRNWPNVDIELMPAIIDAVKKRATLGESMDVLKAVFGWSYLY
jgi:methylmalonyl-CoA mutase N-terminal domain/subunit